MEPNLAASLCGLVDGVDDPHDLEPLLGGRLRALSLRDTPEKVLQLQLVGLLVQISRGVERRRDILELPAHLPVDTERMQEGCALGAVEVQVREILLEEERPADFERERSAALQDQHGRKR